MKRTALLLLMFVAVYLLGVGVVWLFTASFPVQMVCGIIAVAVVAVVLKQRKNRPISSEEHGEVETETRIELTPPFQKSTHLGPITPQTHVLIDLWNGGQISFPRFTLNDDDLKLVAKVVKMVMRTLISNHSDWEQNLYNLHDHYLEPVKRYLERHPAAQHYNPCQLVAYRRDKKGRIILDGEVGLSLEDRLTEQFDQSSSVWPGVKESRCWILKTISDIARTGNVTYLEPLAHSKGEEVVSKPWKPATFWVSGWDS